MQSLSPKLWLPRRMFKSADGYVHKIGRPTSGCIERLHDKAADLVNVCFLIRIPHNPNTLSGTLFYHFPAGMIP